MSNITPFKFENHNVRVITDDSGEPLFVGKDICDALGYADPTTAIRSHCKGVQILHPLQTDGGIQKVRVLKEPDVMRLMTHCSLPEAEKFERLVFEEILPTIRKTGSYSAKGNAKPAAPTNSAAFKMIPAIVRAARALGLDKNAAAISANQAVFRMTGTNVLSLLGSTHLDNPEQQQFFTPTELGKRISTSARGLNLLLAESGMQMKRGEAWEVTDAGREFARIYDTGKKHGSGVPIQQIKWAASVLPLLGAEKEAA